MKWLRIGVAVAVVAACCLAFADEKIKWQTDKYKAFAEAAKKGKMLFLYYNSSKACEMRQNFTPQVIEQPEVQKYLKENFVLLRLDAADGKQFDFGRELGLELMPGTFIFRPDGVLLSMTSGQLLKVEELMKLMKDVMLAYQPMKDAKKAQKEGPEDARANFALGCAYFNSAKRDKDAAECLKKHLEIDKENKESLAADAHLRLGVIALRAKKTEEKGLAEHHFKKAIELDSDGKKLMKEHVAWEKAQALVRKNKFDEAKAAALKLIKDFPKSGYVAKCYMLAAEMCLKRNDIDGAVDAWMELQKNRFGSIEYPEMQKLLKKYWNQSKRGRQ